MKRDPLLHSGHGWIAGILPDGAVRFRAADGAIAATLMHAGAQLVDRDPEVELAPADRIKGDADVCIVPLGASKLDIAWRVSRAVRRLAVSAGVRAQAARAQRTLARRGYGHAKVMLWDVGQPLRPAGTDVRSDGLVGRLPQQAAVIAARSALGPTALEAVIAAAESESGIALGSEPPTVREGLLVMPAETAFLRLAIGPARLQLDRQFDNLTRLQEAPLPTSVLERVPWPHGRGRRNLVDWSVERKLPGRTPRPQLAASVVDDCVSFLVDLHSSTAVTGTAGAGTIVENAEIVAAACPPEEAALLAALAQRAETRLAGLPRGFGHGDFYRGNLLVDDGRLVGVVDWDTAVPHGLPYLDLFHLRVFSEHRPEDRRWGAVVTEYLLPVAQRGGDAVIRDYGKRIGVEASAIELEALVVAYWLDRLAYQLGTVADRLLRERWLAANVHRAARELRGGDVAMIEVQRRLAPLAEEWDRLADAQQAPAWLRPGWFSAWADAFGADDWKIHAVRRNGRLAGVMPLRQSRLGLTSPSNWHTPEFALLAEEDACEELASSVLAAQPTTVSLSFVDAAAPGMEAWSSTARAAGYRLLARPLERSPFVDLAEGWDAYQQRLPRKLRSELRRRRRRLEEEGPVRLEIADGSERLDRLLDEGFRIEAAAWKGERGSAISSRPSTVRFYRGLAAWAAERGLLRLAFLRVGERAIAFDFALEDGLVHALLKTGFDPEHRRLAPGMLLRGAMLERAFTQGLERYDFLGTDEPWKLEWTGTTRERSVVQAFAPSLAGSAGWTANAWGRPFAKRVVKAVRR